MPEAFVREEYSVMENGISDSLDRTLELLKGEVQRVGVAAALAEISGWEGRIAASGDPELESVADTLAELRVQLEGNAFDPVTVGALMLSLGGQVERVAGSGVGASVAGRLSNLAALLGERGDSISNKGMQH